MKEVFALLLILTVAGATFFKPPFHGKEKKSPISQFLDRLFSHRHHGDEFTHIDTSNAEWVCRNPKTKDVMILTQEDMQAARDKGQMEANCPPVNGGGPNQPGQGGYPNQPGQGGWPNQPGQGGFPNQPNNQPGPVIDDNLNINPLPFPTSVPGQDNNQGSQGTDPYGGEGMIDIRSNFKKKP